MIYDMTRTIATDTAVWEGDTPYQPRQIVSMAEGASINLVTLTMTAHMGTHADARYHYQLRGDYAAQLPLDAFVGRARVVSVARRTGALLPADFAHVDLNGGERLLIHSWLSEETDTTLIRDFPVLSVELIEHLAALGYVLIATDAISVDPYDSKTLDAHHALARTRLYNLEQITLAGVPDGDYELIALPLKLDQACASPVRAILRR